MNRRGQVFLLLTILSITFITAISSVLLDLQRSQYLEPSADADKVFEVWDNTIFSIEQTISIQIAINTQPPSAGNRSFATEIQGQMDLLETYLNSRGFIASVNVMWANYTEPNAGLLAQAKMNASISLQITSSSGTSINQKVNFIITYQAEAVGTDPWLLTITKTVNNQTTFLTDISYSVGAGGILDDIYFNGSYDLIGSDTYTITTSENVVLIVTT
ncbi:MAG: hypothetical protein HeimC2_18940 [Candidatus Heimdallarchaeota archaeon LC_2]|nr:MAG: hypothetical protein HeimC2_18940 [Candidatus Heimdallarchaeota archaeon LC_2]